MTLQPAMPVAAKPLEIELPGAAHTLAYVLIALPAIIIALVLATAALTKPPLPLLGLLVVVGACCGALAFVASQHVSGTKLVADADGLILKRMFGEQRYNWEQVEGMKLLAATGTFSDDPFTEVNDRIGIGLFLRGEDRIRENEFDADVMLCAGSKEDAAQQLKYIEKLESFPKRQSAPMPRQPVRAAPRQPNQRREFRATPSTNDMVAAMRNKRTSEQAG